MNCALARGIHYCAVMEARLQAQPRGEASARDRRLSGRKSRPKSCGILVESVGRPVAEKTPQNAQFKRLRRGGSSDDSSLVHCRVFSSPVAVRGRRGRIQGRRSRLLEDRRPGQRRRPGNQHRSGSAFPSTVRDVQNDFLFLGAGWIKQEDALSVDEALEYFSEQIKENPDGAGVLEQSRPRVGRKEGTRQGDRRLHEGRRAHARGPDHAQQPRHRVPIEGRPRGRRSNTSTPH